MELGVRALRDGLSRHLELVKAGRSITVTEHGRPVARIVPVGAPSLLDRLRQEGRVSAAVGQRPTVPDALPSTGSVSDLVSDQRR